MTWRIVAKIARLRYPYALARRGGRGDIRDMRTDVDVIVVGAGVAGLSAARHVRALGRSCVLLEASSRVGGRALTTQIGGAPFDHGASWLHDAHRNPLVDIARATGMALLDSDGARVRRVMIRDRWATADECDAFDAAWDRVAAFAAAPGPDVAFATAIDGMGDDPWAATVEHWEATLIAAADPATLSLRDWRDNELNGANLVPAGGVGDLIVSRLATPVELNTPVTGIDWRGPVRVETPRGVVTGQRCIITVSTGVLAAGEIVFAPALPAAVIEAVAALPMGLLSKVVFPVTRRLELPSSLSLQQHIRRGRTAMFFHVQPFGRSQIVGFVGGPAAWELARAGTEVAFAREELRRLLGADVERSLGEPTVTGWAADPWHRGAYAFARVGQADARRRLGEACGALMFAGEAVCTDGLAGTAGGAYLSGRQAAEWAAGLGIAPNG